jgi:hypothetical protein
MTSPSVGTAKAMRRLFRARWEKHKRGYVFIGFLLFGVAALFNSAGWVVVVSLYTFLLTGLEQWYRPIQSVVKDNKHRWWARAAS